MDYEPIGKKTLIVLLLDQMAYIPVMKYDFSELFFLVSWVKETEFRTIHKKICLKSTCEMKT